MTVILELEAKTEKRLKSEARRRGVSPNQFVQNVLEEKLSNGIARNNRTMPGILREMFSEGIISRIPASLTSKDDDFEPIEIDGKPLSVSLLEDRD